MNISLASQIESILFWKGESLSTKKIAAILSVTETEVAEAIEILKTHLEGRGIVLIEHDGTYMLATHPEISPIIDSLTKEEQTKTLSKAALETLSVIIYRGPVKRSEIDYIRGVNSGFSLRNLLVRGLIERDQDPNNERSFIYKPSLDLLRHLGIQSVEQMPEFEKIVDGIESFESENKEEGLPNEAPNETSE